MEIEPQKNILEKEIADENFIHKCHICFDGFHDDHLLELHIFTCHLEETSEKTEEKFGENNETEEENFENCNYGCSFPQISRAGKFSMLEIYALEKCCCKCWKNGNFLT